MVDVFKKQLEDKPKKSKGYLKMATGAQIELEYSFSIQLYDIHVAIASKLIVCSQPPEYLWGDGDADDTLMRVEETTTPVSHASKMTFKIYAGTESALRTVRATASYPRYLRDLQWCQMHAHTGRCHGLLLAFSDACRCERRLMTCVRLSIQRKSSTRPPTRS